MTRAVPPLLLLVALAGCPSDDPAPDPPEWWEDPDVLHEHCAYLGGPHEHLDVGGCQNDVCAHAPVCQVPRVVLDPDWPRFRMEGAGPWGAAIGVDGQGHVDVLFVPYDVQLAEQGEGDATLARLPEKPWAVGLTTLSAPHTLATMPHLAHWDGPGDVEGGAFPIELTHGLFRGHSAESLVLAGAILESPDYSTDDPDAADHLRVWSGDSLTPGVPSDPVWSHPDFFSLRPWGAGVVGDIDGGGSDEIARQNLDGGIELLRGEDPLPNPPDSSYWRRFQPPQTDPWFLREAYIPFPAPDLDGDGDRELIILEGAPFQANWNLEDTPMQAHIFDPSTLGPEFSLGDATSTTFLARQDPCLSDLRTDIWPHGLTKLTWSRAQGSGTHDLLASTPNDWKTRPGEDPCGYPGLFGATGLRVFVEPANGWVGNYDTEQSIRLDFPSLKGTIPEHRGGQVFEDLNGDGYADVASLTGGAESADWNNLGSKESLLLVWSGRAIAEAELGTDLAPAVMVVFNRDLFEFREFALEDFMWAHDLVFDGEHLVIMGLHGSETGNILTVPVSVLAEHL